ncbi:serine protease [Symmachiella dynata]|uniref:serine protease n=1 Tax=Symmachiella dynata TaxID=2527995 RepID=UPI0018D30D62|nr:serine protease [Symmachiella dynata]
MRTEASRVTLICVGILAFLLNPVYAQESTPASDFRKTRERAKAVIESVSPAIVRFTYGNEPKLEFGCGVIVSASGYVVVSGPVQYVLDDALLDLELADGRSVSGKALGWSSEFGIGMLKITDSGEWPHAKLGERAEAGEVCVALGYRRNSTGTEASPGIRLGIVTKVADGQWLTTSYRSPFSAHPIFNLDGELLGLQRTSSSNHDSVHAAAGLIKAHWDELAAGRNLDRVRLYSKEPDSTRPLPRSQEVALKVIAKAKTASVRISDVGAEENRVSGVIVSQDGYVITCGHHSRMPGTKMTVSFQDGRPENAVVLGTNLVSDIGVLKITDEGTWPYAEMGRSVELGEGEHCVVIGYPRSKPGEEPWVFATTIAKSNWTLPSRDERNCKLYTKGSSLGKGGVSGCGVFDAQGRVIGVLLGGMDGRSASGADLSQLHHSRVELFQKNWEVLTSSMPVQVAETNQLADVTNKLNRIADELSAEDHR